MKIKIISAENIQVNDVIQTYMGERRILKIEKYNGCFDFILNVLVLDNGHKMSNEEQNCYIGYSII